jgi:hypothetical protein
MSQAQSFSERQSRLIWWFVMEWIGPRTVPIVFATVADPVGSGFVASFARPGGNATGFAVYEASLGGKWLEVLKETVPNVSRVIVIFNPATAPFAPKEPAAPSLDWEQMQQMARDLAVLRQNVDQLIASQNQMARQMARLQSDLVDVILKMPEPQRRERQ